MKKALLTVLTVFAGIAAYGQGSVAFDNGFPTGNAITYASGPNAGKAVFASGNFKVELFAGPSGTATEAGLTTGLLATPTSTTPVRFTSPIAVDGYFFGDTAYLQGIASGAAVFQVRAWSGNAASYTAALADPAAFVGKSALFTVAALGNQGSPPTLPAALNMPGFTVAPVPEPSVIVLGVLGVAALLLRRRK